MNDTKAAKGSRDGSATIVWGGIVFVLALITCAAASFLPLVLGMIAIALVIVGSAQAVVQALRQDR